MFVQYDSGKSIPVPEPFKRIITPLYMEEAGGGKLDFSIHMTEWEPGCRIEPHAHAAHTEAMYCVSGRGVARIGGREYDYLPDTMIVARPGERHEIINTGGEKLRVLCVYSPPIDLAFIRERVAVAERERDRLAVAKAAERG